MIFRVNRLRPVLVSLWRDARGVAVLEFALILPVLLLAFFGIMEIAIALFISSTIESAVFQASRFGVITSDEAGVNRADRVREIVGEKTYGLVDMDQVTIDTLVYASFADINKPEPFTDENENGAYDLGEPFIDVNGTGAWEADMGAAGLGGGGDVVVYRVRYAWGIMTPVIREVMGESIEYMSSVAVRNEPF